MNGLTQDFCIKSFELTRLSPFTIVELQQNSLINYEVQPTSFGVCVNCTFLESSPTDCVAVVHQRISQLNSSGLMNIKSSHKFTRSDDTASGCIEGVNLEDYQVGIIAITQTISPTTNSLGNQLRIIGWNLSLAFPFLLLNSDPVPGIVGGMVTTGKASFCLCFVHVTKLIVAVIVTISIFLVANYSTGGTAGSCSFVTGSFHEE